MDRLVYDVATGETTTVPFTPAEEAEAVAHAAQEVITQSANAAATVERTAAVVDLNSQYTAAITRLDQIIGASAPTNPQVVAAVQDLARYVKVLARLNHAEFLGGG